MAKNRLPGVVNKIELGHERTGLGIPDVGAPEIGAPTTTRAPSNFMMVPKCTMRLEKCIGGMKITCVCDDPTTRSMMQNLCNMLAGGMISCSCMMSGVLIFTCNLIMGMCKCEMTKYGCCITCISGDSKCCEMIQSCCDCLSTMMKDGCTCCVMINNTPICCGDVDRPGSGSGSIRPPDHERPLAPADPPTPAIESVDPALVSEAGKEAHGSSALENQGVAEDASSSSSEPSSKPALRLLCVVWEIRENTVRCLVDMNDTILPVVFPKDALLPHRGLQENFKFYWTMNEAEHIQAEDITPVHPPILSKAELDDLLRRSRDSLADPANDVWDDLNKE